MSDVNDVAHVVVDVAIVGGGPAGLVAAEVLSRRGVAVHLFDAMPSVGRKFLLAGKGGMNLTHSEPFDAFVSRYGAEGAHLRPLLQAFGADDVRAWAAGLGIATFVGTSGRVFPTDMKAAPLLRAWLQRLRHPADGGAPVTFHMRHRCVDFDDDGALRFDAPTGGVTVRARATLLALGGASWPHLGSDMAWVDWLGAPDAIAPLQAANCGFDVPATHPQAITAVGWSPHFQKRFAGQPFKSVAITVQSHQDKGGAVVFQRQGEFVATATGVEGSLIYAASRLLREQINAHGHATFDLNLRPGSDVVGTEAALRAPRKGKSLSTVLKGKLGLDAIKTAILHELLPRTTLDDPAALAAAIHALPITLCAARPVAEAISTAGGVRWSALTDGLMLRQRPGVFCAGEMLDWEAPTGGYLLTACMSTGAAAAKGILGWLSADG